MNHLMLDIETLGARPGSAILQISAIPFSLNGDISAITFDQAITIKSCVEAGLALDPSTALWWLSQEAALVNWANKDKVPLFSALEGFSSYVNKIEGLIKEDPTLEDKELYVWGNSNRFDMGLLEAAYQSVGMKIPWKFRNERDVRTLVAFLPQVKEQVIRDYKAEGAIVHDALVDCRMQIKFCTEIFNRIKIDESRLPKSS